jgi:trimethylamine--corrinoid protein Co-methyltransferase
MSVTSRRNWLFSEEQLNKIHNASLAILENPGMRIRSPSLRKALESVGAMVDEAAEVVSFPGRIVEQTIESMQAQVRSGKRQNVLNGVVASLTPPSMSTKFGGACIEILDWRQGVSRAPARQDLINLVRLGEALPEVGTVGNPVTYLCEDDGTPIDPSMQRVKTAALIARYSTKAGPTEVWNLDELKYLIELGKIVRDGEAAYFEQPCFVTAKETISPLILDEAAGEVLLSLAQNGLPCTIIPMPILGGSSPLTPASNIALGNAEILGVFCAIRAACPTANCVGGIISGVLDMRSGSAVFGAPEAVTQDAGIAELHEKLYGFDFGIGGYVDARLPGEQIVIEVMGRFMMLAQTGRFNVPVGLLNGGKRFSPEQALIDLEIERWIIESQKEIEVTEDTLLVEQIRRVGIGGHSMAEKHTLDFMRKNVWYPSLMDRTLSAREGQGSFRDMIEVSTDRIDRILASDGLYEADTAKIRAIEQVVVAAQEELAT